MGTPGFSLLLQGIDTVECAYYLRPSGPGEIDFLRLTALREELRLAKKRESAVIKLGGMEFLLHPYGSQSGYPLVMSNADFHIQFGEFNNPSFFVRFSSEALWRESALGLHARFMQWAQSVGLIAVRQEGLSRVDWAFDYYLPEIDFDEDCFVSQAIKEGIHRESGKRQTFNFGEGIVVLRVYNKVVEIAQKSEKTWFFTLWGRSDDVWRIEWQARKNALQVLGIRSFADLVERQGDMLRYLSTQHDTLRIPNGDSNRSRWPMHPLWIDLQEQIKTIPGLGVIREIDPGEAIEQRLTRIAVSVYGYLKRVAAIQRIKNGSDFVSRDQASDYLARLISRVHEPMSWKLDVEKRFNQMRLGQW